MGTRVAPTAPSHRVVIAWTTISARQQELATLLDGDAFVIHPTVGSTLLRYVVSAWKTWRRVRRLRRGDVCVVTAPPVFAPVVATVAARRGVAIVMDSHPGAFGRMGDRLSKALWPLHHWSLRRATLVLVTTEALAQNVRAAGGKALVFHEPDDRRTRVPALASERGSGVVFPGTFARDEPVSVVLATALCVPEVTFRLTGDLGRAPQVKSGGNVQLTGWLSPVDFEQELSTAAVVLVLSTEQESVMRTAYEAIRLRRPLVVTRTRATETYFPHAWHVDNEPDEIARALRGILTAPPELILNRTRSAVEHERKLTASQTTALINALDNAGVQTRKGRRGRPRYR
jgi:hypothetical protein